MIVLSATGPLIKSGVTSVTISVGDDLMYDADVTMSSTTVIVVKRASTNQAVVMLEFCILQFIPKFFEILFNTNS